MIFEPKRMLRNRFSDLKTTLRLTFLQHTQNISANCFLAWIQCFPKNSKEIETFFSVRRS